MELYKRDLDAFLLPRLPHWLYPWTTIEIRYGKLFYSVHFYDKWLKHFAIYPSTIFQDDVTQMHRLLMLIGSSIVVRSHL